MLDLNTLPVFAAVVESGSFTAAADRLGVAKAKVSLQVARLERELGVALFTRTTRQVTLTDAGRALHAQCQPMLQGLGEALAELGSAQAELAGTLRISTTVDYAALELAPALAEFMALHPGLKVDLRTGDRISDMVAEGIDLSIRIGWLRDSSQRATKVGEFEQYLIASPEWLARHGTPKKPEDLADCEWLALTLLPTPHTWKFEDARGEHRTVHVKSRLQVDSPTALQALAAAGAGVTVMAGFAVEAAIKAGTLVRLLPRWSLPRGGIHAVLPPGRHAPARVRAFIDFYRDRQTRKRR